MAQIPVGSAAQRVIAQPQQDNYAPAAAFDTGAAQLGQVGAALTQIGVDVIRDKRYMDHVGILQARAEAGAALTDHEMQVKTLQQSISERLTTGDLDWRDASSAFSDASKQIDVPTISGLAGPDAEHYQMGIKRNLDSASLGINKATFGAQVTQTKGTVDSTLDSLRKLAGMPNTDVDQVAARVDSMATIGGIGYGAAWGKKAQDTKDGMYFDAATQRFNAARDSLQGLDELKADLSGAEGAKNPALAGKIDSNKRNTLIASIETRQGQLQARLDHDTDKADAVGARAIGEMQKQESTGVPASSEQMAMWSEQVKGTQYEGSFGEYTRSMADTQKLLRAPIADQQAEVQRQRAWIDQHGGSPELQARVKRLGDAVDANVKTLETTPLLFAANRTGVPTTPLDLTKLAQPGGIVDLGRTLQDRVATITALQKQYGATQVQMAPLLPQEADMVKTVISKAPDTQKEQIFGLLGKALPPDAFAGLMAQVKADPATTAAGMAAARGLQTNLGNSVAATLLSGAAILKDKTAVLPKTKGGPNAGEDDALLPYFNANVGDSLPLGDPGRDAMFQVFRAAYMGAGQHLGTLNGILDDSTAHGALNIATGGIAEVNGHKVIKPWGLEDHAFADKVDAELRRVAPASAFGYDDLKKMRMVGAGPEGAYMLLTGRKFVPGKDGRPLIVNIGTAVPTPPGGSPTVAAAPPAITP